MSNQFFAYKNDKPEHRLTINLNDPEYWQENTRNPIFNIDMIFTQKLYCLGSL